jgi:hypothetical protein
MEREGRIKAAIRIFSFLMQKTVSHAFSFPGGKLARNRVFTCVNTLPEERIVDYCVCQVYAVSRFGADYVRKWNASHSFGQKAVERFEGNRAQYHEDKWLQQHGLSRNGLLVLLSGKHPLQKFIFPGYEEYTKARMLGTEVGFYICLVSTLLWTPFSPACKKCSYSEKCRKITRQKYPGLFRLRVETYSNE